MSRDQVPGLTDINESFLLNGSCMSKLSGINFFDESLQENAVHIYKHIINLVKIVNDEDMDGVIFHAVEAFMRAIDLNKLYQENKVKLSELEDSVDKIECEISNLRSKPITREIFAFEGSDKIEEYVQKFKNIIKNISDKEDAIKEIEFEQLVLKKKLEAVEEQFLGTKMGINGGADHYRLAEPKTQAVVVDRGTDPIPFQRPTFGPMNLSKQNTIFIIGDGHCRGLNNYIRHKMFGAFKVMTFFKPNATLSECIVDLHLMVEGFSCEDYVLVVGGSNFLKEEVSPVAEIDFVFSKLYELTSETNVLVTSTPHRFDDPSWNKFIDERNSRMESLIAEANSPRLKWLPTNFKMRHRTRAGLYLNKNGKQLLAKRIVELLSSNVEMAQTNAIEENPETNDSLKEPSYSSCLKSNFFRCNIL